MESETFKKYLGGFFDADGSIYISYNTLTITFSQSEKSLLDLINNYYNKIFHFSTRNIGREEVRTQFCLKLTGKALYPVLLDLEKYSIIKNPQVKQGIEFLKYINKQGKRNERTAIQEKVTHMNKNKNEYINERPYENISIEYIAGLFDGDGHVGIYTRGCKASIAQRNDISLLNLICNHYDGSYVDYDKLYFRNIRILIIFLEDIKPFLFYKKKQVEKSLEYLYSDDKAYKDLLKNQVKALKRIDINNNDYIEYFKKIFEDLDKNYTAKELLLYNKFKEIENYSDEVRYNSRIYNNFEDILSLKPKLIFCESKEEHKIWLYYKTKTSSLCYTGMMGRSVRILVKDEVTGKYIGILGLSSDLYSMKHRDEYIESQCNGIDKKDYLISIGNLNCCVPLQPFGYNTNGGKLLVKLAFSKEVYDYWYSKYSHKLLAINTTSINGKSIMYDRLKELKFLGYTKGFSSYHIPQEVLIIAKMLFSHLQLKCSRIGTMDKLKVLFKHLNISMNYLKHDMKKGIYFGWTLPSKLDKNYDESCLKSIQELTQDWYNRWAKNRLTNVKLKTELELYHKDDLRFKNIKMYKLLEKNFLIHEDIKQDVSTPVYVSESEKTHSIHKLNIQRLNKLIKYKNTVSTKAMSDTIKKEYDIFVSRDDISKFWNGFFTDTLPSEITSSKEYKEMVDVKKKRVYSKPKSEKFLESVRSNKEKRRTFTDEQLINILKDKKTKIKNAEECGKKYIRTDNNQPISRNTVEKIWNGQLKPLDEKLIDDEYNELIAYKRSKKLS